MEYVDRGQIRIWACCAAVWLLLAPQAIAQKPRKYIQWRQRDRLKIKKILKHVKEHEGEFHVRTERYKIRTQVDAAFTAQLGYYMDHLCKDFLRIFKYPIRVQLRPTVYILKDQEAYQEALGKETESRGMFRYRWKGSEWTDFTLYSYIKHPHETDFRCFYLPILNHEGTHQIVQMQAGKNTVHIFLNEGLATYCQFMRIGERDPDARNRRSCFLRLAVQANQENRLPSLESFVHLDGPWDVDGYGPQTNLRYGCAESFVAFLVESRAGQKFLARIYEAALAGQSLESSFGGNTRPIEASWRRYLGELKARGID